VVDYKGMKKMYCAFGDFNQSKEERIAFIKQQTQKEKGISVKKIELIEKKLVDGKPVVHYELSY